MCKIPKNTIISFNQDRTHIVEILEVTRCTEQNASTTTLQRGAKYLYHVVDYLGDEFEIWDYQMEDIIVLSNNQFVNMGLVNKFAQHKKNIRQRKMDDLVAFEGCHVTRLGIKGVEQGDKIILHFTDGKSKTIHYLLCGNKEGVFGILHHIPGIDTTGFFPANAIERVSYPPSCFTKGPLNHDGDQDIVPSQEKARSMEREADAIVTGGGLGKVGTCEAIYTDRQPCPDISNRVLSDKGIEKSKITEEDRHNHAENRRRIEEAKARYEAKLQQVDEVITTTEVIEEIVTTEYIECSVFEIPQYEIDQGYSHEFRQALIGFVNEAADSRCCFAIRGDTPQMKTGRIVAIGGIDIVTITIQVDGNGEITVDIGTFKQIVILEDRRPNDTQETN